ncbi:MAG: thioredoxin domain-containing protein [Candidatus Magasanikbacteria bacterium]|nr:thioredoxin domain-containing protein [Candidatus Magasanikbacteria bacterium]
MDAKRILTWGGFILGLVVLLMVLAKYGTSSVSNNASVGAPLKAVVTDSDWSVGSKDAPHTLVEYTDFQCPACASYHPLLKRLGEEHGKDVRIVYRHFPLDQIHPNARAAARASEAAGLQGKYFEMQAALFNTQGTWGTDKTPHIFFEDLAFSVGLDVTKFKADLNSTAVSDKVNSQVAGGVNSGVNSTPSLFFDGTLISNPGSYEELVSLVTAK